MIRGCFCDGWRRNGQIYVIFLGKMDFWTKKRERIKPDLNEEGREGIPGGTGGHGEKDVGGTRGRRLVEVSDWEEGKAQRVPKKQLTSYEMDEEGT